MIYEVCGDGSVKLNRLGSIRSTLTRGNECIGVKNSEGNRENYLDIYFFSKVSPQKSVCS